MNIIFMITYVITAVLGSTLIKYGSNVATTKPLFILPVIHMGVSVVSLVGIVAYGVSFMMYIVLLSRFDLSFISPLLLAIVYLILMLTAHFIFKEQFTTLKITGCSLILIGIVFVLLKK